MQKPRKTQKQRNRMSYKSLHRKAWKIFSLWIRKRDNFTCFTCGKKDGIMNAGHFYHNYLDFDEQNINCQCSYCNKWLSGNLAIYAERLIEKYGIRVFKNLSQRRFKVLYTTDDLIKIIKKYELP